MKAAYCVACHIVHALPVAVDANDTCDARLLAQAAEPRWRPTQGPGWRCTCAMPGGEHTTACPRFRPDPAATSRKGKP